MLLNTIDALENKLEKFSSDNLKSMLCIHSDISNKLALIVDDMSTSTSHAFDSELDSIDIKPLIVDTACLENPCLNNCVKPKSKDTNTQAHGKFVPTCYSCGKVCHIRSNCFLLKSHRSWIKEDAPRKGKVEKSSSSKSLSQNGQKGSLLVCDWLYSVGQNHFYVMMLIIQGCFYIQSLTSVMFFKKTLCRSQDSEVQSLASVRTTWYSVQMLIYQASSVQTTRTFRPDLPYVSRSFELFSVASVRTSKQHVRTPFSVRQVKRFLSKTHIWEDSCNRPDDVVFPSERYL
jgi:hypothetical protein